MCVGVSVGDIASVGGGSGTAGSKGPICPIHNTPAVMMPSVSTHSNAIIGIKLRCFFPLFDGDVPFD